MKRGVGASLAAGLIMAGGGCAADQEVESAGVCELLDFQSERQEGSRPSAEDSITDELGVEVDTLQATTIVFQNRFLGSSVLREVQIEGPIWQYETSPGSREIPLAGYLGEYEVGSKIDLVHSNHPANTLGMMTLTTTVSSGCITRYEDELTTLRIPTSVND